ncbi:formin-like protein 20 [Phoenix dactylifera]|uniref:Formin-like protein 20 n=1 Tax=Phoenix dactylifera TaxID=42345 RepID=A0A8B7D2A2_PHODC|nr:formin-like protein 20 [Phoenix dactylifera]
MAAELEDRKPSTSDPDKSDGDDSDSLSLCDVAPAGNDESDGLVSSDDSQLSPPPPPPTDPFEFFPGDHSAVEEMCSADDVFHQGQLLPYKPPPPQPSPAKTSDATAPKIAPFDHRRSESLNRINRPRGGGAGLAAEYRRLRRAASDSDSRTPLPPPTQPPARPRSRRPKWYLVVFGSVRVPAAMEMKDIRNRQRRQRSLSLAECGGLGYEGGRGPWKLLQSLSCNGAESAVVSTPLNVVSHVPG